MSTFPTPTCRGDLKRQCIWEYFGKHRRLWKCVQTLSFVFDISSQSKTNKFLTSDIQTPKGKIKLAYEPIVAHQARVYPGFSSMKRLGVFLLPPGWDASPSQGYPFSIKFAGTHSDTCVERGTVRVNPPRTQHNVSSQGLNPDRWLLSGAH